MHSFKLLLLLLPCFLVMDFLWLGLIMKSFYLTQLGDLVRRQGDSLTPRLLPAALVYLLIPAGLVLFVRPLTEQHSSYLAAAGWGALFGLILYGVYDFTNLAVLEKWTVAMTLVDIAWGCFLCSVGAMIMFAFQR